MVCAVTNPTAGMLSDCARSPAAFESGKTAGLRAPQKRSERLRDAFRCCAGEGSSSSHVPVESTLDYVPFPPPSPCWPVELVDG